MAGLDGERKIHYSEWVAYHTSTHTIAKVAPSKYNFQSCNVARGGNLFTCKLNRVTVFGLVVYQEVLSEHCYNVLAIIDHCFDAIKSVKIHVIASIKSTCANIVVIWVNKVR